MKQRWFWRRNLHRRGYISIEMLVVTGMIIVFGVIGTWVYQERMLSVSESPSPAFTHVKEVLVESADKLSE